MSYKILSILQDNIPLLKESLHGLEKESLRVTENGLLSSRAHPTALGSKLFNPYITTDFAEAQLELITPPFKKEEDALHFLHDLHSFVYQNIGDELLWPFSIPCDLPDEISISDFGSSLNAKKKYIYRQGLVHRYGIKMQMFSGIHYNFSISDTLWSVIHSQIKPNNLSLQDFKSKYYLNLIRNYERFSWISTYLYGASPLSGDELPESTSIRMSSKGYHHSDPDFFLNTNSIDEFILSLEFATTTKFEKFAKIGTYSKNGRLQLNENILQNSAEYYARIRPKAQINNTNLLDSLKKNGISYVEVRNIDLSPFHLCGIDINQLRFLHILMLYCLIKESPLMDVIERQSLEKIYDDVALYGLDEQNKKSATIILTDMLPTAKLLGSKYEECLKNEIKKINSETTIPSRELKARHPFYLNNGIQLAKKLKSKINNSSYKELENLAKKSIQQQHDLEYVDDLRIENFDHLEISTQALIREAWLRGIDIDIIDHYENFIKLSANHNVRYVKQATKTDLDSYITYLIMESKFITKLILMNNNMCTPAGTQYNSLEKSLNDYHLFKDKKIVVKPNSTNYGIGINFVKPNSEENYSKAIKEAFKHSPQIVIEDFFEGKEYRFLVIGDKVSASCTRLPAHIIGNGKDSIETLVEYKNKSIRYNKIYPIKLCDIELDMLRQQGLTPKSIPAKNKKVLLRENSNVSTGGDSLDTSDDINESYNNIALKAARAVNAKICGVDMIIKDIHIPAESKNHTIIELNFNPALLIHRFPTYGKKRYVEKDLLDLLGF